MKQLFLELKRQPSAPTEAEVVSPDAFAVKTLEEIRKLKAWEGNNQIATEREYSSENFPRSRLRACDMVLPEITVTAIFGNASPSEARNSIGFSYIIYLFTIQVQIR